MRTVLVLVLVSGCAENAVMQPAEHPSTVALPEPSFVETTQHEMSDTDVDERVASITSEWKTFHRIEGDLAAVPTMRYPALRGHCYRAAVAVLSPGSFVSNGRLSLDLSEQTESIDGDSPRLDLSKLRQVPRVLSTSDIDECPTKNGTLELAFSDGGQRVSHAGSGSFHATIYETPIDEAALRQLEKAEADADAAQLCLDCMRERLQCQRTGEMGEYKTCEDQFRGCLGPGGPICKP